MALNFKIKLDEEVSAPAGKAASALAKLDGIIRQESSTLKVLESQLRAMSKSGLDFGETQKKLTAQVATQKGLVAGLTSSLVEMGGAGFAPAKEKGIALEGVLTQIASKGGGAGRALAALGPYGLAAAAAMVVLGGAIVGVAGAIVYLESKLVSLGVKASEAKGDVTRSLELLYGSQVAAEHTYKVLEAITGDIAISQDRVMELADTLIKAGQVNGDAMVRSIETIGKAEAARAGAGKVIEGVITRATQNRVFSISRAELMQVGISYKELAKQIGKGAGMTAYEAEIALRTGGVRVKAGLDALGKIVDTKMGDLAMRKFQTVTVQTQRLHDAFGRLFEDVDASGFARVIMVIANQLSESSVAGAALRSVLKSAFEEVGRAVERVSPYVQLFFEGAVLLALKFYNALYPVRQALAKLFPNDAGSLGNFEDSILLFVDKMAAGFAKAATVIKWIIDHISELSTAFDVASKFTGLVLNPVGAGKDAADLARKLVVGNDNGEKAKQGGLNVAAGTAAGIRAGTPQVESAMLEMAKKSQYAFDRAMEIQSPSRVMRKRGLYIDQGLAQGVNDNAQLPASAMAAVSPGIVAKASGASSPAQGGGVVVNVTFQPGAVVVGGLEAAEDQLTEMMADVFERAAAMQAAG